MIFSIHHLKKVTVLTIFIVLTVNVVAIAEESQIQKKTIEQSESQQQDSKSQTDKTTPTQDVKDTVDAVKTLDETQTAEETLATDTEVDQNNDLPPSDNLTPGAAYLLQSAENANNSTNKSLNTQTTGTDNSQLQVLPKDEVASLGGIIEPRDFEGLTTEQLITTEIDGSIKDNTLNTTRIELDIPVPDNALVDKHRKTILSNYGREWLYKVMSQATLYYEYIIDEMHENDMPECIACLPVIESSYVRTAVSKSGAVGLWQFMENSIAPFLLKNHWVDERLDPWLSTEAAIKKLKDNYNALGDWYLALAAYNCGLGATKRALAKSEVKDFWYMAEHNLLPAQTIQYVPRFLAVADIIKNANYYGVTLPDTDTSKHPDFVKLTINKAIDIPLLSDMTGIKTEVFDFLNPALKYNMTPPLDVYFIRVPAESVEKVSVAIENLDESMYSGQYTVRQGDTLWGISRKYDISVADLCTINKLKEKAILRIGTVLNVPILK